MQRDNNPKKTKDKKKENTAKASPTQQQSGSRIRKPLQQGKGSSIGSISRAIDKKFGEKAKGMFDDDLDFSSDFSSDSESSKSEYSDDDYYDADEKQDKNLYSKKQMELRLNKIDIPQLFLMRRNLLLVEKDADQVKNVEKVLKQRIQEGSVLFYFYKKLEDRNSFLDKLDTHGLFLLYDIIDAQKHPEKEAWVEAIRNKLMKKHDAVELKEMKKQPSHTAHANLLADAIKEKTRQMYTAPIEARIKEKEVDYYPGMEKEKTPTPEIARKRPEIAKLNLSGKKEDKETKEDRRRSKSFRLQDLQRLSGNGKSQRSLIIEKNRVPQTMREKAEKEPELSPRAKSHIRDTFAKVAASSIVTTRGEKPVSPRGITSKRASFFEEKAKEESPRSPHTSRRERLSLRRAKTEESLHDIKGHHSPRSPGKKGGHG